MELYAIRYYSILRRVKARMSWFAQCGLLTFSAARGELITAWSELFALKAIIALASFSGIATYIFPVVCEVFKMFFCALLGSTATTVAERVSSWASVLSSV